MGRLSKTVATAAACLLMLIAGHAGACAGDFDFYGKLEQLEEIGNNPLLEKEFAWKCLNELDSCAHGENDTEYFMQNLYFMKIFMEAALRIDRNDDPSYIVTKQMLSFSGSEKGEMLYSLFARYHEQKGLINRDDDYGPGYTLNWVAGMAEKTGSTDKSGTEYFPMVFDLYKVPKDYTPEFLNEACMLAILDCTDSPSLKIELLEKLAGIGISDKYIKGMYFTDYLAAVFYDNPGTIVEKINEKLFLNDNLDFFAPLAYSRLVNEIKAADLKEDERERGELCRAAYDFGKRAYEKISLSSRKELEKINSGILKITESLADKSVFAYPESHVCNTAEKIRLRIHARNIESLRIDVYRIPDSLRLVRFRNIEDYLRHCELTERTDTSGIGCQFAQDRTFEMSLPAQPCGNYIIRAESGNAKSLCQVSVTDIFYSYRNTGKGLEIYAADSRSGRPIENAIVNLYSYLSKETGLDELKLTDTMRLRLSGFTAVPANGYSYMNITVPGGSDTYSAIVPVSMEARKAASTPIAKKSPVFTDRKLYRSGEPVTAKAILYETAGEKRNAVKGALLKMEITDPRGDMVADTIIETDDFGSAAWTFRTEPGARPGRYVVRARECGENTITGSTAFRIEEYYVPVFELKLDDSDHALSPKDTAVISGHLESCVGNNVSSLMIDCRILVKGYVINGTYKIPHKELSLEYEDYGFTDSTGAFEFKFPLREMAIDILNRNSTPFSELSSQGELESFRIGIEVFHYTFDGEYLSKTLDLTIADDPVFIHADISRAVSSYGRPSASIRISGYNSSEINSQAKVSIYRESIAPGNLIAETAAHSGESIDLAGFMKGSGKYVLHACAEKDGHKTDCSTGFYYIDIASGKLPGSLDTVLVAMLKADTIAEDEPIEMTFATSAKDTVFLLYEFFGKGEKLDSGIIPLGYGISTFKWDYPADYPDRIAFSALAVKNGETSRHVRYITRKTDEGKIFATLHGWRDKLGSGQKNTVRIKVTDENGNPAKAQFMITAYNSSLDRMGANSLFIYPGYSYDPVPYLNFSISPSYAVKTESAMADNGALSAAPSARKIQASISEPEEIPHDSDFAVNESGTLELRDDFDESLFVATSLETDENGMAEFEIEGGDLLSDFRMLLLAHTEEMAADTLIRSLNVSKDCLARSNPPKTLVQREKPELVISGVNNTPYPVDMLFSVNITDNDGNDVPFTLAEFEKRDYEIPVASGNHMQADSKPRAITGKDYIARNVTSDCSFKCIFEVPSDCHGDLSISYTLSIDGGKSICDGEARKIKILPVYEDMISARTFLAGPGERIRIDSIGAGDMKELTVKVFSPVEMIRETVSALSLKKSPAFTVVFPAFVSSRIMDYMEANKMIGASSSREKIGFDKISSYMNEDGGFSWIKGMASSAKMTMMFLQESCALSAFDKEYSEKAEDAILKAVRYIDNDFSRYSEYQASEPDYAILQYLATRTAYGHIPIGKQALKNYETALHAIYENGTKDATPRKLFYIATIAGRTGNADLYESAIASLKGYMKRTGDYIIFPNASEVPGDFDMELTAHMDLWNLFHKHGDKEIASGIYRWILMQRSLYEWGTALSSLKASMLVLGIAGKPQPSRFSINGTGYKCEASSVWEKTVSDKNGIWIENTGKHELTVTVHSKSKVRVDSLHANYNGIRCHTEIIKKGNTDRLAYTTYSPLYMDNIVMKGAFSSNYRPIDERSYVDTGFGFSYYREVREDGVYYYFEVLPKGRLVLSDVFYDSCDGEFFFRGATAFKE